jgi:hypothetical protein
VTSRASLEQVLKHGFVVMAERCDQCLYGSDKIVSNDRRKEIIRGLDETGGFFICHKSTILGRVVACRGDMEQRGCGQTGRIAEALGMVTYLPEDQIETLPEGVDG